MADKVQVTSAELRGVADDLDEVARKVQAVLNTLAAARTAAWGSWGADEFGGHFSGGNGYIKSDENLDGAVGSKVALLHSYSGGLREGARVLDGMEDDNRRDLQV
ncbi:type VII secretion target [Nocardia sp. NPDC052566]|uniref:type VII secretion target n=1 Tax=Nocardia sp. NPDC052566 TaxID=3364330 RepID=UPI0037CA4D8D